MNNKLKNLPTVYYVSVEDSENRRQNLVRQFSEYGVTSTKAMIYQRFQKCNYNVYGRYVDNVLTTTKASTTSHLNTLKWWLENTSDEYCIVMEDDVSLETVKYWNFTWEQFFERLPEDWDAVQLCIISEGDLRLEPTFRRRIPFDWGAQAYLIRRKHAKRLVDLCIQPDGYFLELTHTDFLDLVPITEHILFDNFGVVYNFPLFVEDVTNVHSTFVATDPHYISGHGNNHIESFEHVINWWKTKGKTLSIDQILPPSTSKINLDDSIENLIRNYARNTEDDNANYCLGRKYQSIGQTAAAISFYLRTADRTSDNDLAYECLLRMGDCFNSQGGRKHTVKAMYQAAIALCPKRPEAYFFLSRFLEWHQEYFEAYTIAELGLTISENQVFRKIDIDYPGKCGLIFEKAVSSWWRGRNIECRKLFQELKNDYWDELTQEHKNSVEYNITRLGSGSVQDSFKKYDKRTQYDRFRFKFKGLDNIESNYSQVYQDMFVLAMLDGKQNGTFVEIGGGDPFLGNNTALLETQFGWKGISIELSEELVKKYRDKRPTEILHTSALDVDYDKLFSEKFQTTDIDYLQLDIEPSRNTYECMLKIPFDKYRFAVITYEHDHYVDVENLYRQKSRDFLKSKGYVLVANDISANGECSFEDWWAHPDLINPDILKRMTSVTKETKAVRDYIIQVPTKDETKDKIVKIYSEYDSKYGLDWGWCTLCKAGAFIDCVDEICQTVKNPVCVEIGVFKGKSLLPISLELKRHNKGKIYAIDPWSKEDATKGYTETNYDYWNNLDYNEVYRFFENLLKDHGIGAFVNIIRKPSDDAEIVRNINFLHIDGQHTEQAIRDAKKYASNVVVNGYCFVDDVNWGEVMHVPDLLASMGFISIKWIDQGLLFKRTMYNVPK